MQRIALFKQLIFILCSTPLLINSAYADHKHHKHHHHQHQARTYITQSYAVVPRYEEDRRASYGRVVAAQPIYRNTAVDVPVETCHLETYSRQERSGDSFKGTLVGGLVGAALGHELGNGRSHSTAAGGIIGAAIGNNIASNKRTTHANREVCHTEYRTEYQRELVAYKVTYKHQGRIFHTETQRHPGERILIAQGY